MLQQICDRCGKVETVKTRKFPMSSYPIGGELVDLCVACSLKHVEQMRANINAVIEKRKKEGYYDKKIPSNLR